MERGFNFIFMIQYTCYKNPNDVSADTEQQIADFLFQHLDQYGDARTDIQKCLDYALYRDGKSGGILLTAKDEREDGGCSHY